MNNQLEYENLEKDLEAIYKSDWFKKLDEQNTEKFFDFHDYQSLFISGYFDGSFSEYCEEKDDFKKYLDLLVP